MSNGQNALSQLSQNASPNIAKGRMTHSKFLLEMDEILNLPPGTLRGHEKLEELENWDSTSLIIFIALADETSGVSISPAQIVTCSTVSDLLRLARVEGIPA